MSEEELPPYADAAGGATLTGRRTSLCERASGRSVTYPYRSSTVTSSGRRATLPRDGEAEYTSSFPKTRRRGNPSS